MLNWEELELEEEEEVDEAWETLVERYGYNVRTKSELEDIRESNSTIEAVGVCWLFAEWAEGQGYEGAREIYDDLSCDRGGRWDLMDNIDIGDGLEIGAAVLNGNVVNAEIWSDDRVVGYVSIN